MAGDGDVGVRPRWNTLLYGPPGCGKTTLAHHFAARLGLPLIIMRVALPPLWKSPQKASFLANLPWPPTLPERPA